MTDHSGFNLSSSRMSHSCQIQFQFIYKDLKKAEKKAADFCLQYPEKIVSMTIGEVAQAADCSQATLSRLARKLGYSGYMDFRKHILKEDEDHHFNYNNISPDDGIETITTSVFRLCMDYIQDSLNSLNIESMENASRLLRNAKSFLFTANGDAYFVAASGAQKFSRLGMPSIVTTDLDSQIIALSNMSPDDVLICISHSGNTKNVCEVAQIAKSQGIKIISITNFPKSSLAKISDVILLTASFARDTMDEVIAKRIPALCLLDSLYIDLVFYHKLKENPRYDRMQELLTVNKI